MQKQQETTPQTTGGVKPKRMVRVVFYVAISEKILSGSYTALFESTIDAVVDAIDNIPKICRVRVWPVGADVQPLEITGWAA